MGSGAHKCSVVYVEERELRGSMGRSSEGSNSKGRTVGRDNQMMLVSISHGIGAAVSEKVRGSGEAKPASADTEGVHWKTLSNSDTYVSMQSPPWL